VILRLLLAAALSGVGVFAFGRANGQTPAPTPSAVASPSLPKPLRLAPYKERLAKAKSVEVQTDILGIGIDSSLVAAHTTFDSLGDAAHRPKEKGDDVETDERVHKVLWQLAKTDFGSIYVKADDKDRITYIAGFLRPGKEIPFDKIGQVEKAPIQTDKMVAWDVVRPNRLLIRVIARGSERKASSLTVFIVKRAQREN
jgi:hypothetical protein